jgi:Ca2+/Na+ antiporter
MFHISYEDSIAHFAFFGTIVGYNFVKYDALARAKKIQMRNELKAIALFSFCCFILVGYYFFQLQRVTQIVAVVFLSITLLYTLPFFPTKRNARNWAGVKIYIVALCWVGVTLGLPILNAEIPITADFYLKCLQRFILIFVLVLVFEIIDLANDDPHLKTVPQQIGVRRTKLLGLLLLLPFYFLEFLKSNFDKKQLVVNLLLVIMISLFLIFANDKRSKYYTSFWVESIPIVWWMLLILG